MKNKLLKTAALASTLLFGASANALTVNYDVIDLMGISGDASTGVSTAIELDYLIYGGNSFTTNAPVEGASFIDIGHIEANSGSLNGVGTQLSTTTFDFSAQTFTETTYTLSVTFTDWVGTYYDVVDAENFSATFSSGSVSWDLTTSVTVTDLTTGITGATISTPLDNVLVMDLVQGEGDIDDGSGDISVIFEVVSVLQDFIYVDVDGNGTLEEDEDLADLLAALTTEQEGFYLGWAFGTNTLTDQDITYGEELMAVLIGADLATPDGNGGYIIDPSLDGFIATNVGAVLFASVPEPGMLSMMGLALLGFAGFSRRRKDS
ncbi:PEP-CTERM sorting domain-containing protein [Vibrio algarum]|uniref:PEP-CTERM sorting domain-containing protein n=1 Tax=Vibrio algarum TaxID=3020714 RepID=A0ABT4YQ59_9VIBR|nr:PEP-CTERM sorting domain-containing protein [Vibrio sp. KJ40-1]MDB1123698.1 PEP-CTERM sorting domain-containing protein [Vibrio sp. KJ40-1]